MRILLAATQLAAACTQAQPKPAPEATREAAGQRIDAGQQAANEPGGSAMGTFLPVASSLNARWNSAR